MKVVRSTAQASEPCQAFASTVYAEAAAAHSRKSRLPSLPGLKEKWCSQQAFSQPAARAMAAPAVRVQPHTQGASSMPQPSSQEAPAADNTAQPQASQSVEDLDPDAWWPAAPRQDDAQPVRTHGVGLAAVATSVHHRHRHKALRHAPLDANTMLNLREDLLAGRDVTYSSTGGVWQRMPSDHRPETPEASSHPNTLEISALQVSSVASANVTENKGASRLRSTSHSRPVTSLMEITSNTFSWLGSSLAGVLDFVCDGSCGGLGVQRRTAKSALIIN